MNNTLRDAYNQGIEDAAKLLDRIFVGSGVESFYGKKIRELKESAGSIIEVEPRNE